MSTKSFIGIKENNEVKYIYCNFDGYIDTNGAILLLAYKDIDRIRKLLELGDIRSLGYNIEAPRKFDFSKSYETEDIHIYNGLHFKTSYCDSYIRDYGHNTEDNKCETVEFEKYLTKDDMVSYAYYYDVELEKWFVKTDEKTTYDLERIFTDKDYYYKFDKAEGENSTWTDFKYNYRRYKKELDKVSIDKVYNDWLKRKNINHIKFKTTNNTFNLYKIEGNNKTLMAENKCIGDLINVVLQETNISFYGRETYNG